MRRRNRIFPRALATAALVLATVVFVQLAARATAPDGRYKVGDTTVKDRRTGLVWRRTVPVARLGRLAAEAACEADLTDGGNWRLPTATELLTLVDVSTEAPAIDSAAFPATPPERFWTSTPYVPNDGWSWVVDFSDGSDGSAEQTAPLAYRCVQSPTVAP